MRGGAGRVLGRRCCRGGPFRVGGGSAGAPWERPPGQHGPSIAARRVLERNKSPTRPQMVKSATQSSDARRDDWLTSCIGRTTTVGPGSPLHLAILRLPRVERSGQHSCCRSRSEGPEPRQSPGARRRTRGARRRRRRALDDVRLAVRRDLHGRWFGCCSSCQVGARSRIDGGSRWRWRRRCPPCQGRTHPRCWSGPSVGPLEVVARSGDLPVDDLHHCVRHLRTPIDACVRRVCGGVRRGDGRVHRHLFRLEVGGPPSPRDRPREPEGAEGASGPGQSTTASRSGLRCFALVVVRDRGGCESRCHRSGRGATGGFGADAHCYSTGDGRPRRKVHAVRGPGRRQAGVTTLAMSRCSSRTYSGSPFVVDGPAGRGGVRSEPSGSSGTPEPTSPRRVPTGVAARDPDRDCGDGCDVRGRRGGCELVDGAAVLGRRREEIAVHVVAQNGSRTFRGKAKGPHVRAFPLDLRASRLSGWRDSNPRPLRPERSALPSCATPRGAWQG